MVSILLTRWSRAKTNRDWIVAEVYLKSMIMYLRYSTSAKWLAWYRSHIRPVSDLISRDIKTADTASDWLIANSGWIIDQFRYIKIQSQTIDLSTRLWGINTEFVGFIDQSLVLRSIVWDWILIYRNWSIICVYTCNFPPISTTRKMDNARAKLTRK